MTNNNSVWKLREGLKWDREFDYNYKDFLSYDLNLFWQDIKRIQENLIVSKVESTYFKSYNFYHDFILRFRFIKNFVFINFENSKKETLTYSELYRYVEHLASIWERKKVNSGKRIAIILPIGKELVIALGVALKLGLISSFLPPMPKSLLEKKLKVLSPDFVCTNYLSLVTGTDWEEKTISVELENLKSSDDFQISDLSQSKGYSYKPNEEIFEVLLGDEIWKVKANEAYLMPLSCALSFLELSSNIFFVFCGDGYNTIVPSIFLSCMSVGSCFVFVKNNELLNFVEEIKKTQNKFVYMIEPKVRDIFLTQGIEFPQNCYVWLKDPFEDNDLYAWDLFIRKSNLDKTYCGNIHWDSRICGCILISPKIKRTAHFYVLPPFGVEWKFFDPVGIGEKSKADIGFLSIKPSGSEKEVITDKVVAKNNGIWVASEISFSETINDYISDQDLCKFVLNFLKKEKKYNGFIDLVLLRVVTISGKKRVLLIFLPEGGFSEDLKKEILDKIERTLGTEFLPEEVEFFLLFPHYEDSEKIDKSWCLNEYLFGRLKTREKNELFRLLTKLKVFLFKG